jgi:uncharacterized protein YpbB
LTFEKAVIDVGRAFAPGQVYVALSRLTSLDGLILRTPISPDVVSTDTEVVEFSKRKETQGELGPILQQKQAEFLHALLSETYDFSELLTELDRIRQKHSLADEFEDADMRAFLPDFKQFISDEVENTLRFKNQLAQLLAKRDDVRLVERLAKGSTYYEEKITSWIQKLLQHLAEVALLSKTKSYQDALEELDTLLMRKWEQVQKAEQLANSVLHDSEVSFDEALQRKRAEKRAAMIAEVRRLVAEKPKNSSRKTGRLRKVKDATSASKPKAVKGQTYVETYALLNEGLSIAQVAAKRGLSLTTIEGHAAKGIGEGSLRLEMFLNSEQITEISAALAGRPLKDAYEQLAGRYGFGQLRMVEAARKKE